MTTGPAIPAGKSETFYAAGAMLPGAIRATMSCYFTNFLLERGISAGAVASTLLVSRMVDACWDPLIGNISDNTQTTYGRRKTYILVSIPLVCIVFIAIWIGSPFSSEWATCVWYGLLYALVGLFESAYSVNHDAVVAEMVGTDSQLRVIIKRTFFFVVSTAVASIGVSVLLQHLSEKDEVSYGYLASACLMLVLTVPVAVIGAWMLPKSVDSSTIFQSDVWRYSGLSVGNVPASIIISDADDELGNPVYSIQPSFSFSPASVGFLLGHMWKDYRGVVRDREFLLLCVVNQCIFVLVSTVQATMTMYVRYVLHQDDAAFSLNLIVVQSGVICGLAAMAMLDHFNKVRDKCAALRLVIYALVVVSSSLLFFDLSLSVVFIFGAGISASGMLIQSLLSSVVSADSRRNLTGSYYGFFSVLHDVGSGISIALVGTVLWATGYKSGDQEEQPESAEYALRLVFALLPLVSLLVSLVTLREFSRVRTVS